MATDNPFDISGAPEESASEASRRKKLSLYGLQNLGRYTNEQDTSDLQEQPLYGGALSKSPNVSPEAGEPSQLATERVQRAPAQQEASPLLGPEERLGNIATGEEGSYGPLTGEQRSLSLRSLFPGLSGSQQGGQEQSTSPQGSTSRNVGGAGGQAEEETGGAPAGLKELGYAKSALSAGGKGYDFLKDLFKSGGIGGAFPANRPTFAMENQGGPSDFSLTGEPTEVGGGLDYSPPEAATGAGGPSVGSYAGGGASVLGLIASIYGLASGSQVTPGMIINLMQNGVSTVSQLAQLAVNAGLVSGESGLGSLAGLASAAAIPLGAAAGLYSVSQAANMIGSGEDRQILNGISQLIGGPGAGMLSGLITQNMPLQPYLRHRQGASEVATEGVGGYIRGLQNAINSGDISAIQQNLSRSSGTGMSGAALNLPPDVAKAIGLNDPQAEFKDLTPEQFVYFLKAYDEQSQAGQAGDNWFRAEANVPYLGGHQLLATTNYIRSTAYQVINSLVEHYKPLLDQLPPVAPVTPEAIADYRRRSDAIQAERNQAAQDEYNAYLAQIGARPQLNDLYAQAALDQQRYNSAGAE